MESAKYTYKSNSDDVKQFTEESGYPVPKNPMVMNEEEIRFIIRMVMSELSEMAATVTTDESECRTFMENCLKDIDLCKNYQYNTDVEKIAAQADSMVDAWYYMLNTSTKKGVNLSKLFDVIHKANMDKRDPETGKFIRRDDGKIMKPANWQPPNIEGEIEQQIKQGSWNDIA